MSNALRKHKRMKRETSIVPLGPGETVRVEGNTIIVTGPTKNPLTTTRKTLRAAGWGVVKEQ
jgi:hypothetical protein